MEQITQSTKSVSGHSCVISTADRLERRGCSVKEIYNKMDLFSEKRPSSVDMDMESDRAIPTEKEDTSGYYIQSGQIVSGLSNPVL